MGMIVMRSMQNIASTGRTILATIHQPNVDIFSKFQSLLLLQRGGHTVFFGELGEDQGKLINYFQSIDGVEAIPDGYNAATWMLDVIAHPDIDFPVRYRNSELKDQTDAELEDDIERLSGNVFTPGGRAAAEKNKETTYVLGYGSQVKLLASRMGAHYWRSPDFSFSRLMVISLISVIMGCIFVQQDYKTVADTQSRIAVISFTLMLGGTYNLYTIIPFMTEQRANFYRERSSGMYATWFCHGHLG